VTNHDAVKELVILDRDTYNFNKVI